VFCSAGTVGAAIAVLLFWDFQNAFLFLWVFLYNSFINFNNKKNTIDEFFSDK
jgi:hypothetical protein